MFQRISVTEAARLIEQENALIVDIRDPNTFAQGHIQNATRIDNQNIQAYLNQADKSKPIVVCCYHGNSSQSAADLFQQQGFEQSYSMDGGMCEWALTKDVVIDS